MDRTEFVVAVAVLVFGAFLLGFLTHWLVTRLSRVSDAELGQIESMATDLHQAEEDRDTEREARHQLQLQMRTELGEMKSELAITREALAISRREADELRAYMEAQNMGPG